MTAYQKMKNATYATMLNNAAKAPTAAAMQEITNKANEFYKGEKAQSVAPAMAEDSDLPF